MTDITQDIPFIQANFQTKYFLGYNDNLELDKKIHYIKDNYSESKIEQALKNLDYSQENILKEILLKTQNIINASEIKPIELGIIYIHEYNKENNIPNNANIKDDSTFLNNKDNDIGINSQPNSINGK